MRIRLAIPDHLVTPETLEAALEATALASEQAVARGEVPHAEEAISRGVRWKPEPFTDGEHFDLPEEVIARGWGDCDDLAPYLAGSMRASGEDPGAVPRVYQSGPGRWHVVVQTSDGEILDPSKWAGMGRRKSQVSGDCALGVCGTIARPFARPGDGAIAVMPHGGYYYARADVPYPDSTAHLASISRARDPDRAVERAVSGAIECGTALGVDCERASMAGTFLIGDAAAMDEVGLAPAIPVAMALAPKALSVVKNLFGKKDSPRKALRRALKGMGLPEAEANAMTAQLFPQGGGAPARPDKGLSLPLETETERGGAGQHMMLHYWPQGAPGPVVMRY